MNNPSTCEDYIRSTNMNVREWRQTEETRRMLSLHLPFPSCDNKNIQLAWLVQPWQRDGDNLLRCINKKLVQKFAQITKRKKEKKKRKNKRQKNDHNTIETNQHDQLWGWIKRVNAQQSYTQNREKYFFLSKLPSCGLQTGSRSTTEAKWQLSPCKVSKILVF